MAGKDKKKLPKDEAPKTRIKKVRVGKVTVFHPDVTETDTAAVEPTTRTVKLPPTEFEGDRADATVNRGVLQVEVEGRMVAYYNQYSWTRATIDHREEEREVPVVPLNDFDDD